MAKYVKILDFVRGDLFRSVLCSHSSLQVKNHMTYVSLDYSTSLLQSMLIPIATHRTKLKLFTTFDQQVEVHNSVLGERAKVLEGVKTNVVAQSGNILG